MNAKYLGDFKKTGSMFDNYWMLDGHQIVDFIFLLKREAC